MFFFRVWTNQASFLLTPRGFCCAKTFSLRSAGSNQDEAWRTRYLCSILTAGVTFSLDSVRRDDMHIHVQIHLHIHHIHVHIHTYIHTYIHTSTYIHTYIHTHIHVYLCLYIVFTYRYMFLYVCLFALHLVYKRRIPKWPENSSKNVCLIVIPKSWTLLGIRYGSNSRNSWSLSPLHLNETVHDLVLKGAHCKAKMSLSTRSVWVFKSRTVSYKNFPFLFWACSRSYLVSTSAFSKLCLCFLLSCLKMFFVGMADKNQKLQILTQQKSKIAMKILPI